VQYFRDVLQMIREEIGEESYWLACISPFAPFLGYADGMRVANDSGVSWGAGGTLNMFHEMCAGHYFNDVWWQNDPDSVFLRENFLHLNEAEIQSIALFTGMMGGSINTSDWLHQLPPHRLRLWRFIAPGDTPANTCLPFWHKSRDTLVAVREYSQAGAWVVLSVNLTNGRRTEQLHLRDIVPHEELYCYRWSAAGAHALGRCGELVHELEPHASALYFLSSCEAPPPPRLTAPPHRTPGA
jgi:hypothetical protein